MTTPRIDDDRLQRYFDGELPAAEADEVRQAVEASEEHRARLEQLERLRGLMRMAADDMALEVGSDDLYARVRSDLQAQERRKGLRAIAGGRRGRVIAGTAVGLAAAAAVAFALLRSNPAEPREAPVAHEQTEVPQEPAEGTPAEPRAPAPTEQGRQGSEVVEVDFGGNTGTVFDVEGEPGHRVAVVWINEQEQVQ